MTSQYLGTLIATVNVTEGDLECEAMGPRVMTVTGRGWKGEVGDCETGAHMSGQG
jgi:hypothetical protein